MVLPKYAVALLQFALLLVTSLSVTLKEGFDTVEMIQFAGIAAGAIVTYFVPLVSGPWAGALKTGMGVVIAILSAVIPFVVAGTITADQVMLVVLAALNALASEVGIAIRKTSLSTSAGFEADPEAAKAVGY